MGRKKQTDGKQRDGLRQRERKIERGIGDKVKAQWGGGRGKLMENYVFLPQIKRGEMERA